MKTIVFHTSLRSLVKPLLDVDPISVSRTTANTDGEGNPLGARVQIFAGVGTFTECTDTEQLVAAQRGTRLDKALCTELGLDIQGGDWITSGTLTFEVIEVDVRRLYARHLLRLVN